MAIGIQVLVIVCATFIALMYITGKYFNDNDKKKK